MKKLITIVVVSSLLGTGAFFYFSRSKPKVSIERVIPAGPLVYMRIMDIETRWTNFKKTKLWQNINSINIQELMEKQGLSPKEIAEINQVKAIVSDPAVNSIFMKFFGNDVGISFYAIESFSPGVPLLETLAPSVLIVSRLNNDAKIADFATRFVDKKLSEKVETYKKYKITSVELQDKKIHVYYSILNNFLVIGLKDQVVKNAIDTYLKEKPSLFEDARFNEAKAQFIDGAKSFGYGNLESMAALFSKQIHSFAGVANNPEDKARIDQEIKNVMYRFSGLHSIGFSLSPGNVLKYKFDIFYNKDKLSAFNKKLYSCPTEENKSIAFVPQNIIGYQWSNCSDLKDQWENLKAELQSAAASDPSSPSPEETIASFESNLNLSIEKDILPVFSDEIGGYLAELELNSALPIPIPKLVFFIKVKDKLAAENIISRLVEHQSIVLQTESYKDVVLKFLMLPFGETLQPAYCLLGDYLLISTNRETLKKSIDTFKDPALSLVQNGDFKTLDQTLEQKNNSTFYLRIDRVVLVTRNLLEWGIKQSIAKSEQELAFKGGIEQRLDYSRRDLSQEEAALKELIDSIEIAKSKLKSSDSAGNDADSPSNLNQLELQAAAKIDSIKKSKETIAELEETVQNFKKENTSPDLQRYYLNNVITPLLNSVGSFRALDAKVVFKENYVEVLTFIQKDKEE